MVIGSRPFSGQGQVVKAHFWPVKDLDPGRGRINRVYGSDPPLFGVADGVPQTLTLWK